MPKTHWSLLNWNPDGPGGLVDYFCLQKKEDSGKLRELSKADLVALQEGKAKCNRKEITNLWRADQVHFDQVRKEYESLRPTCVRLGLRSIGWHVLCHSHATWLSESGATIRAAQDILGQTDMETTLRVFTHSVPDSKRRAITNVAALLFPSVPPKPLGAEGRKGLPN